MGGLYGCRFGVAAGKIHETAGREERLPDTRKDCEVRIPLIAGNWKMNLDRASALAVAAEIASSMSDRLDVRAALCPPNVYLSSVAEKLTGARVGLGAQNMHHEASGAFTGEVSAGMLLDVGCRYVILGHSERRQLFGETDAMVQAKVQAALKAGLRPIVCVGELLEQRQAGQTLDVIGSQFTGSLAGVSRDNMNQIVIAYEPVWAIGTGEVATPSQAEEVHASLREMIASAYDQETADQICIQYGGSVKPDNAVELMAQPNVDGALVGGASLKADSFMAIVGAACSPCA